MNTSESIGKIAEALVKAQTTIVASVAKNAHNETFGQNYANLGAVIEAVKPALTAVGIVVIQSPTASTNSGFVQLTTRLIHQSGEWIEDTATAPMQQHDPQGFGSAISYLRRYALGAIMGLYANDDDDGELAKRQGTAVTGVKPADTPAKPAAVRKTPEEKATKDEEALQKRVKSWLDTISNASIERLATAKTTARGTFTGTALDEINKAIASREQALNAVPA